MMLQRCINSTSLRTLRWSKQVTTASTRNKINRAKSTVTTPPTAATNKNEVPIATSLLAAAAGICTVSGVSALVDSNTASDVPPFDPKGERFSQKTFGGRFAKMLLACDPMLLLYSKEDIRKQQQLLESFAASGKSTATDNHALWEAKRIYGSAVHPDTGDIIPRPFRMSGFVVFNGPICVAMVASTSTLPLLFWSWVNQSQNALVNFYNRNASSPMTNETLVKSYVAAVGLALSVAFGLATFVQRKYSPDKAKVLLRYVAFPSAVVASSLNCYIVRSPEIETGIPLLDEDGNTIGGEELSMEAAKRGVYSTTASRAILQAPVYFLPPILLSVGPLKKFVTKFPKATVPVTTYLVLVAFGVGLPGTVAIFPQISTISAKDVEKKFHHYPNPKTDKPYEIFYYNKGL